MSKSSRTVTLRICAISLVAGLAACGVSTGDGSPTIELVSKRKVDEAAKCARSTLEAPYGTGIRTDSIGGEYRFRFIIGEPKTSIVSVQSFIVTVKAAGDGSAITINAREPYMAKLSRDLVACL